MNQNAQRSWVADINTMHQKFGVHEAVEKLDKEKLQAFLKFRLDFLYEELKESYKAAGFDFEATITQNSELQKDPEEVVDGLIDLSVVAIGTLDIFQVDSDKAWVEVLNANMAKEPGIKPTRPNVFGLPDMIKPQGWEAPSHIGNHGLLTQTLA